MKNLFLFLVSTIYFVFSHGSTATQSPLIEDYGDLWSHGVTEDPELDTSDLDWLYEQIMPLQWRQSQPKESRRSFDVHTVDTFRVFPHPDKIVSKNVRANRTIEGQITYAGVFRKPYAYELTQVDGSLVIAVRVYVKNLSANDRDQLNSKILDAESIWNRYRLETDFSYQFKFELVDDPNRAHFKVTLKDSTRGPYDTFWSREWTAAVVAHEIGHMMGLGDEYHTVSGKMECLTFSLMCSSWSGDPLPHNYYFILRRVIE